MLNDLGFDSIAVQFLERLLAITPPSLCNHQHCDLGYRSPALHITNSALFPDVHCSAAQTCTPSSSYSRFASSPDFERLILPLTSIAKMAVTCNYLGPLPELQHEVLSFCDSHTLTVTCLVARGLLEDSRDVLYHTVRINERDAALMVSNASHLVLSIRHLRAVITGHRGSSMTWISLFTILKNSSVISMLDLLPPPTAYFNPTPEEVRAIDALSHVSSIHTFMAELPTVHPESYASWTLSSLALWGARLRRVRVRRYSPHNEMTLRTLCISHAIDSLELHKLIKPSHFPIEIREVRRLAIIIRWKESYENKIRDILNTMAHTRETFTIRWFGDCPQGPTITGITTPLVSLTCLAILMPSDVLSSPQIRPFLQGVSSCAPNLHNVRLFLMADLDISSLQEDLMGNEIWIGIVDTICKLTEIRSVDLWLQEGTKVLSDRRDLTNDLQHMFARFARDGSLNITWDVNWSQLWPFFD
ncbi:hypothetical protein DL96DRAFT_1821009 [Flagelloscypha sp. PMI_526]|nr:hypothetical protein DL96DRAFT_1821009 [Flagelloscypha sp. PMI_526]